MRQSLIPCLRCTVTLQALVVQGGIDGSLRPELHRIRHLLKSSEAPRTPGVGRRPQELSPPPKDLLSFAAPSNGLSSSVYVDGEQRAKPLVWRWFLLIRDNNIFICRMQQQAQIILLGRWSKPSSIVVVLVSLHGVAAWRGGRRCTCEATINTSHANTPR